MTDTIETRLITSAEAAKILSISERKLFDLRNTRHIPFVRIDRSVRYDPADLRAWIEAQKSLAS